MIWGRRAFCWRGSRGVLLVALVGATACGSRYARDGAADSGARNDVDTGNANGTDTPDAREAGANVAADASTDAAPEEIGYRCQGTNLRIARARVCDRIADCPLGDDEPCSRPVARCPAQAPVVAAWLGAAGVCEVRTLGVTAYDFSYRALCASGAQIQPSVVCDGSKDCPDGDDELGCPIACERTCDDAGSCIGPPCSFFCADGSTVPVSAVCDGTASCAGGEDEECVERFACVAGRKSEGVDFSHVCDGVADCANGADELECPPRHTFFICDDGNQILFPYFGNDCSQRSPWQPSCADGSAPTSCPNPH